MIDDALTNPPMPEWNNLPDEVRQAIVNLDNGCCCCCVAPAWTAYDLIRDILKQRERRFLEATMAGPSYGG